MWALVVLFFLAGFLEHGSYARGYFVSLRSPVHAGWFGEHKRWRGLVVFPAACVLLAHLFCGLAGGGGAGCLAGRGWWTWDACLVCMDPVAVAGGAAFAFNAAELPNSFLKRRLGIAPGRTPSAVWWIADHLDSVCGCALYLRSAVGVPFGALTAPLAAGAAAQALHAAIRARLFPDPNSPPK